MIIRIMIHRYTDAGMQRRRSSYKQRSEGEDEHEDIHGFLGLSQLAWLHFFGPNRTCCPARVERAVERMNGAVPLCRFRLEREEERHEVMVRIQALLGAASILIETIKVIPSKCGEEDPEL